MAIARAKTSRPQPWVAEIGAGEQAEAGPHAEGEHGDQAAAGDDHHRARQPGPLALIRLAGDMTVPVIGHPNRNLEVPNATTRLFPARCPPQPVR